MTQEHLVEEDFMTVKVADGRIVQMKGSIQLFIRFQDKPAACLRLRVLDGLSLPIVIGIVSIMDHFKDLFIQMLQSDGEAEDLLLVGGSLSPQEIDSVKNSYKNPLGFDDGQSLEEAMIPESECLSSLLELRMNNEEAKQSYYSKVSGHISTEFSQAMGDVVLQFLHSETALRVFVPDNWNGINGIPPLKLEFSSDMPRRIKPQNRRVPPALLEATKLEFDRMCGYFYTESTSPVASPLVVAKKNTPPYIRI